MIELVVLGTIVYLLGCALLAAGVDDTPWKGWVVEIVFVLACVTWPAWIWLYLAFRIIRDKK